MGDVQLVATVLQRATIVETIVSRVSTACASLASGVDVLVGLDVPDVLMEDITREEQVPGGLPGETWFDVARILGLQVGIARTSRPPDSIAS